MFCSLFYLTVNIYEWSPTDYDKTSFLLSSWITSRRNRTSRQILLGCSVILAKKSRGSAHYLFPVMLLIWLQNSFLLCEEMSALSCNILPCCKKPYWIKYKKLSSFFFFLFYVNLFYVSSKTNLVTVTASSYAGLSLLGKVSDVFHCQWSLHRNIFISCRHNSETAVCVEVSLNLVFMYLAH